MFDIIAIVVLSLLVLFATLYHLVYLYVINDCGDSKNWFCVTFGKFIDKVMEDE